MSETNHQDDCGRTLVTGGTGDIGGHLVKQLHERGADFAVMCRRTEQRRGFEERGIATVHGDFSDAESLRTGVRGFDQLFLLSPGGPDQFVQDRTMIDAAKDAGITHILKVSTLDANPDSAIPWAKDHARADDYLSDVGIRWTRFEPGAFTKNFLELAPAIRRGVLPGTSGNGATSWVDVQDIAEAAALVLTNREAQGNEQGRRIILTGTHPLSFPEVAAILSTELGHKVRYVHLPGPLMYAGLRAGGVPDWQARGLVRQFVDVVRRGADRGRVHTFDLQHLLGHPTRGVEHLTRDNAALLSRTAT